MSSGILEIIKRAAIDAVEATKPSDLKYGTVISENPVKVRVTPQFIIPSSMIIIPQYLTDYEIEVSIYPEYNWNTLSKSGGTDEASFASHTHAIQHERKKIKIHGALKKGDKVVMIRQAGGQHFLILDRLVE